MRRSVVRLLLCVLSIAGSWYAAGSAWAGTTPYRVQADTVSDSAITVSWVTTTSESGYVKYGTSAGSLTSIAYDTRGSSTTSGVHCVVISGLSASTTYHWKIVSGGTEHGDASGSAFQTTTGGSLILLGSRFVTGQVLDEDGNAAADALVHVTLRDADGNGSSGDSQSKTVLSDSSGNWIFLLESFRTASLGSGYTASTSGDTILVTADGGASGRVSANVDSSYASSSPTTISTSLVAPGVPVVTSIAPSQGTRTVSTNLTISGSELLFVSSGELDDTSGTDLTSLSVVSDSVVTATVPSGVVAGTYNVKLTSSAGTNSTSAQQFTATLPPSIDESTLAGWTAGQSYSHAIASSGGAEPLSWTVTAGSPPAGLTLSSVGVLAGTPTAAGTSTFTAQVTDNSGVTASQELSITIAAAVSTPSGLLYDWTVGRNYGTSVLSTTGGTDPITITVTGLPPGLAASGSGRSKSVSGTPTSVGAYTVAVAASDSTGSAASRNYTVVIHGVVTTPAGTLPDWTIGRDYGSRDVTTSGGTGDVTWTTTGLPPGITATPADRTLTFAGTPSATGSYSIVATATDVAGSSASQTFAVTINAALSEPGGSLPDWTVGRDYGVRPITTTGGTAPVTWTATGMPAGLAAAASGRTLTISGTPTTAGAYSVVVTAADAAGSSVSRTFALTVSAPVSQPTGSLPNWTSGVDYGSRSVTTTGGTEPLTWTATGVPPGLSVGAVGRTLTLSGNPTTAGTYSIVATVTDAAGSTSSQTFAVVVSEPVSAPVGALPSWTVGRDYGTRSLTTTGGTDPIVWSTTGLPPGLLATASGRTLSVVGTPNLVGAYAVVVTATDSVGSTASSSWTVTIAAPLTTPTGTLPDWTVGQPWGNRVLATTGGTDPVAWTVTGLPPGTTASGSGRELTVSGTPSTAGTYSVNAVATDGAGSTASRTLTVVINAPLTPLTGALPDWTVGRNYGTRTVATTGGTDPVTWTATGLPSGLSASSSGRAFSLSGFPDTAATYFVTITATDAAGSTASHVYTVVINPALSSPSGSLPDWTVGRDYGSHGFTSTGGTDPIDWSVTGLPPGLLASPSGRTVTVTGTPTTAGTYSVVLSVSDGAGASSTRALTMVVNAPMTAAAGDLPDWTQGRPYGARTLTTTGGTDPVTWTLTGLPAGLTSNASGRTLTLNGTPSETGLHSVVVTVSDAAGSSASRTIPVRINAPVSQPQGTLPDWTVGREYGTRTLTTTGGTDAIVWTVTGLPPGLFATPTGRSLGVVGTPSQTGTFNVSATVTDAAGSTASSTFVVTVNVGLSAPAGALPDWTAGRPYGTRTITTTGGTSPVTWTVTGLPLGLVSNSVGRSVDVSGTPTDVGTHSVVMTATDAAGATASRTFTLVVNAALTAPMGTLPDWTIGRDFGTRVLSVTGGTEPIVWTVSGLPPGLVATQNARALSVAGVPATTGDFNVSVSVSDTAGSASSKSFSLTINAALTSAVGALPDWTVDRDYGVRTLTVTGGTDPITWSVSGLPAGLSGASDGRSYVIRGTPSSAGSYIVLASVSDPTGSSSTAAWPVTIHPALAEADGELPDWTVGFAYGEHTLTVSGGTDPVTWEVTGLPTGLSGAPSGAPGRSFTVSGAPTEVGSYTVLATVTDGAGATSAVSIPIVVHDVLRIADATLPAWTSGRFCSHTMQATGGTPAFRWELLSGLPPGFSFDAATATYSGTVPKGTQPGDYEVIFRVTDVAGSTDQRSFTIRVNAPVAISKGTLRFASVGKPYVDAMTLTDGTGPFVWSFVSPGAPGWLTLDPESGSLTGVPDQPGVHEFDVTVTDAAGSSPGSRRYRLEVAAVLALDDTLPQFEIAPGQPRLLLAFDGLRGSKVDLRFQRPDKEPMTYTARLVKDDDSHWFAPDQRRRAKVDLGRRAMTLRTPALDVTERYFVALEGLSDERVIISVGQDVKYGTKFRGTIDASGKLDFAAPLGAKVTIDVMRGRHVLFVERSHEQTGAFVALDNLAGPTLEIDAVENWGDYDVRCLTDDGSAVTLRYLVTVRPIRPKRGQR